MDKQRKWKTWNVETAELFSWNVVVLHNKMTLFQRKRSVDGRRMYVFLELATYGR